MNIVFSRIILYKIRNAESKHVVKRTLLTALPASNMPTAMARSCMDIHAMLDVFFCLGVRRMLYSDSYVLELATAWVARAKIAKHAKLARSSLCSRVFFKSYSKINTELT